jgi:hypothetical protein
VRQEIIVRGLYLRCVFLLAWLVLAAAAAMSVSHPDSAQLQSAYPSAPLLS